MEQFEYFTDGLKRYADFTGRATRKQFWMYVLFYVLIYIAVLLVTAAIGMEVLVSLYVLGMLIPTLAIGARRMHDINRTGWWQLLLIIPLLGSIIMIIFWVQPTVHEGNRFGS